MNEPLVSSVVSSVARAVHSALIGFGAAVRATFAVDLSYSLTPLVTAGSGYTYSRGAAGGTITDFKGLVKDVGNDEPMFDGVRHVRNLATNEQPFTTETLPTILGHDYVFSMEGTGTVVFTGAHVGTLEGVGGKRKVETVVSALTINLVCTVTGTVTAVLFEKVEKQINQNPSDYVEVVTSAGDEIIDPLLPDADFVTFAPGITFPGDGTAIYDSAAGFKWEESDIAYPAVVGNKYLVLFTVSGLVKGAIALNYGGVALVPAAADGDYSEIVQATTSGGLGLFTFDGGEGTVSNVSVKEVDVNDARNYSKDNRNTVTGDVVNENTGQNIQPSIIKGASIWEERTNFADTGNANTQIIDLSAQALTDYIVSCEGTASFTITAGTATATISDATVTEASPGQFDMTVAGTMVITRDSGTLDISQADDNIIQLEAGLFKSPFIPTPVVGATVTRPAALLEYDAANYTEEGTMLVEFEYNFDPADLTTDAGIVCLQESDGVNYLGNNSIDLYVDTSGQLTFVVTEGGVAQFTITSAALSVDTHYKVVIGWAAEGSYMFLNSSQVGATQSGDTMPTPADIDAFYVGARETALGVYGSANCFFEPIQKWDTLLSEALAEEHSTL